MMPGRWGNYAPLLGCWITLAKNGGLVLKGDPLQKKGCKCFFPGWEEDGSVSAPLPSAPKSLHPAQMDVTQPLAHRHFQNREEIQLPLLQRVPLEHRWHFAEQNVSSGRAVSHGRLEGAYF